LARDSLGVSTDFRISKRSSVFLWWKTFFCSTSPSGCFLLVGAFSSPDHFFLEFLSSPLRFYSKFSPRRAFLVVESPSAGGLLPRDFPPGSQIFADSVWSRCTSLGASLEVFLFRNVDDLGFQTYVFFFFFWSLWGSPMFTQTSISLQK